MSTLPQTQDNSDLIYFNGLDATTGGYLTSPRTAKQLAEEIWAHQEPYPPLEIDTDDGLYDPTRVSLVGLDTRDLSQAGWGVIFPAGVSPRIKRAMAPLLELRRQQVGDSSRYHEFYLDSAEQVPRWLASRGGVLRPDRIPYYLLMVGGPAELPFELQIKLGSYYAIGRIAFERVEEYREYARRVVLFAGGRGRLPREATIFSTTHAGDRATEGITRDLVAPLAHELSQHQNLFGIRRVFEREATKSRLLQLFDGPEAPAVLLTAGHGLAYPAGHPQRLARQGALVCSDFQEGFGNGPISHDVFVSSEDLNVPKAPGLISFHLACYGIGTPRTRSSETRQQGTTRHNQIPFLSCLPQRLLARPNGSLAVIGNVDRSWSTSLSWDGRCPRAAAYEEMLHLLFQGQPIGAALDPVRQLWDDLANASNHLWQQRNHRKLTMEEERRFVYSWMANNETRTFAIYGDPAVSVAARGIAGAGPNPHTFAAYHILEGRWSAADSGTESTPASTAELSEPNSNLLDARLVAGYLSISIEKLAEALKQEQAIVEEGPTASILQPSLETIKRSLEILENVFRDRIAVLEWWNSPHPDLGQQTPMEVLLQGHGQTITDMLEAALGGTPS